jgi:EmrB/QacA subfamily drug resistance transporter
MRKWLPLMAICLGAFMLLVDVAIVTVALPDMATDLGTSFTGLQWVLDIYALTLAALLLGAGSVADLIGRRRLYVAGLAVFALASLVCGVAPNIELLVAARGVQGIGAAAMFATTMALLNSTYHGRDRGIAFGVWGATNGAAAAAGPILGGLLTEQFGWRTIFLVNLPVSVITIALTVRVLRESRDPDAKGLDLPGVLSFTLGAGALTYGFISASDRGWGSSRTLGLLVLGIAALAGFVVIERRRRHPMLDLSLFRRPAFVGLMTVSLLLSAAAFAYLVYTSLWLQSVLGLGPISAGLALLPLSACAFVTAGLAGRFLHAASPRLMIGGGMLLIGAGALMQAVLDAGSTRTAVLPGLVVTGVGVGLATPSLASAAMASVPHARAGMAAGAVNTFRQLGYALGLAILGVVFQTRMEHALRTNGASNAASTADALSGGQAHAVVAQAAPEQRATVSHLVHSVFATALNTTVLVAAAIGLVAGVVALALVRRPSMASPAVRPPSAAELATEPEATAGRIA